MALPFIGDGLRRGECCLYVPNGTAAADLDRELLAQGIDSAGARETGALAVILSDIWRDLCQQGSIALAREVLALMDSNLDAFDAVRIAGDFAWAKAPSVSADALCHWEATANVVFQGLPARVICQYDIDRYEPAYIHAALRTHPVVLYKGRRVRSPYYDRRRSLSMAKA